MTVFTLWFLPQMFFYGLTALATALLNAHRRFVAAAFAPVINNLLVIGVLVAFAQSTAGSRAEWIDVRHISGDAAKLTLLGAGTTAGIAAMALVLLPALRHARTRLHLSFDWRHPAVRKMLRLSGWTVGYVITNQVALLFVLVLAKSGTTGKRVGVPVRVRVLPSSARTSRGVDHDDDDAGALAQRRAARLRRRSPTVSASGCATCSC